MSTGVVVIDDQPDVSNYDPAFFFDMNEGFQEVTSKKTQKSKQKAAQEEAQRKAVQDQPPPSKKEKKDPAKVAILHYFILPS